MESSIKEFKESIYMIDIINGMTLFGLKDFAKKNRISIKGKTKKDDIKKSIIDNIYYAKIIKIMSYRVARGVINDSGAQITINGDNSDFKIRSNCGLVKVNNVYYIIKL